MKNLQERAKSLATQWRNIKRNRVMGKRGPKPGRLRRILTGQVFGRLRVVGYNGRRITGRKDPKDTDSFWRAYCDPELGGCGAYSVHSRGNLLRKKPPGA